MTTPPPLIVLAAGGTGGHVFPAEALARELLGRGLRVAVITDKRGGTFSADLGLEIHTVPASALRKGFFSKIKSVATMGLGLFQANRLLKKLKPAAVVGFGGYPSIPTLMAAMHRAIPFALHEQNAVMGRANLAVAPKAALIATSFPHVRGLETASLARILQTGNPVRPAFAALRGTPYPALTEDGPLRLLVLGGSLGASVFSTMIPKALALLPAQIRDRLMVSQQCRPENLDDAKLAFAGAAIEAELTSFFRDVPERMASAHLVISRAGGSTIAELTAIGRPSILVPFPHGHAGEQTANAEALADAGGAFLIPEQALTPESLAVRLEALLSRPETLATTAAAARAWGTVTAAEQLADGIEDLIGGGKKAHAAWMTDQDHGNEQHMLALSTRERTF